MSNQNANMTSSLEDYLETIFEIIEKKGVARVKDIAAIRNVKPGSVSPAMRRLADAGYIVYNQGEYITLTDKGSEIAVKTLTRHKLLYRFLVDILGVNLEDAENDACAMEHSLSDSSVNKLTSFFEFFQSCPEGKEVINKYFSCPMRNGEMKTQDIICKQHEQEQRDFTSLDTLNPGETGTLAYINSDDKKRKQLINMGFLPGAKIFVEKKFAGSSTMTVLVDKMAIEINIEDSNVLLITKI